MPTVYNSLQSFSEFKVEFHHIYIMACKDLVNKWNELMYPTTDDVIFTVLESWLLGRAPTISMIETEKSAAQWKEEEEKLWMA